MPKIQSDPDALRPYLFHGIDLQWTVGGKEATGECPFCGREKFSVSLETGQWCCFKGSCDETGNAYTFLRKLCALCFDATDILTYNHLATDRGINADTLFKWYLCQGQDGNWLVPGYNEKGALMQLYKYVRTEKGKRLLPTPGLKRDKTSHQLHGVNLYNKDNAIVYLCEGPWDAMILWEALGACKVIEGPEGQVDLVRTASPEASLLGNASVLAVPGAMVFREAWCSLFAGKVVNLMYDNDHERKHPKAGNPIKPAGLEGMKRVAGILSSSKEPPLEINYLAWGASGSNTSLPHGYDVRDALHSLESAELGGRFLDA